MRQTSYVWNELVENGEFHMDAVARIYGATGTDPDAVSGSDSDGSYREYVKITSPVINRSLLSGNILSIGNCVSGTLNFSIMTTDNIPKSAKIKIMGRVTDGKDENPVQSDWLTFGTFWIDHRTVDDDFIDLECYDAMKMGNQLYDDPTPSAQWPRAVSTIVTRIAQQIGVSIDSRTTKYFTESGLWGQSIVTMPTTDTLNDILGHIGGILGGNWYITEENKLRYIPLISAPVDAGHILSHASDKITTDQGDYIIHGTISSREAERDSGHITSHANDKITSHAGDYIMWETLSGLNTIVNLGGTGCVVVPVIIGSMTTADSVSITRVTVSVNADTTYTYGTDDGFELIVSENPYATDALTAALYERVKGVVYSPYNITTAVYNPATELGDWVIAGDVVSSTIFTQNIRIGIGFDADISAPGENELENEFPYKTIEQKVTEKIETTETTLRQETVSAVESATNQITGANGSQIQFLYDENKIMKEIVIMDTNSTNTAQKVWRWNGNGFGYSKNGYNGPYGLAITQDGAIVADFLTVGIIKSPTNADTFWNLSKGELKIKGTGDTSPAIHVKTYMDGDVEKTKTEINADKITTGTFNADGNSVKIRGKLTDWNNSNGNYWNLDTGDFQVKGSSDTDYAIRVSNGITNINANNITVGTISPNAIDNNSIPNAKLSGTAQGGLANRNQWQINFNTGNITIGDISANSVVTGEIKNESNRNNYWNLNTGELKVGSTESSSDYAIKVERLTDQQGNYYWVTNINADKITTGEIKNASNRNNYWNLETGEFRLGSTETSSDYAIKVERKQNQQGNYYWTTDINANSIKAGELKNKDDRYNYWNLDDGTFRIGGSGANDYAIKIDDEGVKVNALKVNGTVSSAQTITENLSATKIKGGTLTLGGTDGGNYKNGSLELYDSSNKLFGRWDRNKLSIGKWDSVSESLLESFSVASNTGNVTITDGVLQNIVTDQYGTETKSSILKIDGATIYGGEYYESADLSTIKFTNVLGTNRFANDISLNSTGSISLNANMTSDSTNFGILGCGGGITFESNDHGIILNSNNKAKIELGKDTHNEGLKITVNGILSMKKSSTSDSYFYVNHTGSSKRFEIGPISKLSVYDDNKREHDGFTTVITMYSENQSPPYTVMTFAQGVLVNVDYKENP